MCSNGTITVDLWFNAKVKKHIDFVKHGCQNITECHEETRQQWLFKNYCQVNIRKRYHGFTCFYYSYA